MTVDAQYGIETSILSFQSAAHNGFETVYSGLDMRMCRRVLHGRSKHALVSLHYTQIIVHVCKSSHRYIVLVRSTYLYLYMNLSNRLTQPQARTSDGKNNLPS